MIAMATLFLSAQNFDIYPGDGGDPVARTGKISAELLWKAGVEGVILGHSETEDTPDDVRGKLGRLFEEGRKTQGFLSRTTCLIGEAWEQFQGHAQEEVATSMGCQILRLLQDAPASFLEHLVVGYEPKWGSRGSGHDDAPPPAPELISACVRAIRQNLTQAYGSAGAAVPVIYGGRSTPERTRDILADQNVAGLILGSACDTVSKTLAIAGAMRDAMGSRSKILHANFKAFRLNEGYEVYIRELRQLDDTFTIYLSPNFLDLRTVRMLLSHPQTSPHCQ